MKQEIKQLIQATRPWSFPMTWISAGIATVLAIESGPVLVGSVIILFAGLTAMHAATNVLNDIFDFRHGVDTEEAPTAKYRLHPLISGTLSVKALTVFASALYAAAIGFGVYFVAVRGWPVLLILLTGIAASVFYTGDPVSYKHRALGELSVFIMWGPLMVAGGAYVLSGATSAVGRFALVSIPHGVWVALVLFANNLKDIDFDGNVRIKTLGTMLGRRKGMRFFAAGIAAVYCLTIGEIVAGVLPVWAALTALSALPAIFLFREIVSEEQVPADADPKTAKTGTIYGVLLISSLVISLV